MWIYVDVGTINTHKNFIYILKPETRKIEQNLPIRKSNNYTYIHTHTYFRRRRRSSSSTGGGMQKLEMCIEALKLAIEFIIAFFEAVGSVIHQTRSAADHSTTAPVPAFYAGILP